MSHDEKVRSVFALPSGDGNEARPPEGDAYRKAKWGMLAALEMFFRRTRRKAYLSSDLLVFFPDGKPLAPDLFVVFDIEPKDRVKYVVSAEGKVPDFVLLAHLSPERGKELEGELDRLASFGVPEVVMLDRARRRLRGFRLRPAASVYEQIEPEEGRIPSRMLGLDVAFDGERVRFFYATAGLPEPDEMIARLSGMLHDVALQRDLAEKNAREQEVRALDAQKLVEEAARLAEEVRQRADEETHRADEEAVRADAAEQRLSEALSELHKLKGWE